MRELTFITGNANKAKYLELWLGRPMKHHELDLIEIQSLDLQEVVMHKVTEAFRQLQRPVLVEDVALTFHGLGRLPGTLVKWFLEELGTEGLCELLGEQQDRSATAEIIYGLHDGQQIHYFHGHTDGRIVDQPRGTQGFGWNAVFVPAGSEKTYAEMTDDELEQYSFRAQAIAKLRTFLDEAGKG
jgi:non-canonical purine NTP pyrophosphatase (RdgB/HAM1 family)